jgi:hypothetical protein
MQILRMYEVGYSVSPLLYSIAVLGCHNLRLVMQWVRIVISLYRIIMCIIMP